MKKWQLCRIIPKQNVEINEVPAILPFLSSRILFSLSVAILQYVTTRKAPAPTNQNRSRLVPKLGPGPRPSIKFPEHQVPRERQDRARFV